MNRGAFSTLQVSFVSNLIEEAGVAMVPGSIFFHSSSPHASDACPDAAANGTRNGSSGNDRKLYPNGHASVNETRDGDRHRYTTSLSCSNEYVRVAICKRKETLEAAIAALQHYFDTRGST